MDSMPLLTSPSTLTAPPDAFNGLFSGGLTTREDLLELGFSAEELQYFGITAEGQHHLAVEEELAARSFIFPGHPSTAVTSGSHSTSAYTACEPNSSVFIGRKRPLEAFQEEPQTHSVEVPLMDGGEYSFRFRRIRYSSPKKAYTSGYPLFTPPQPLASLPVN